MCCCLPQVVQSIVKMLSLIGPKSRVESKDITGPAAFQPAKRQKTIKPAANKFWRRTRCHFSCQQVQTATKPSCRNIFLALAKSQMCAMSGSRERRRTQRFLPRIFHRFLFCAPLSAWERAASSHLEPSSNILVYSILWHTTPHQIKM